MIHTGSEQCCVNAVTSAVKVLKAVGVNGFEALMNFDNKGGGSVVCELAMVIPLGGRILSLCGCTFG